MELLQPKTLFLRLNLEQAQHIIDGLFEVRQYINHESLPLYDSQTSDILNQFQSQGINIIPPEQDEGTDEVELLKEELSKMRSLLNSLDIGEDNYHTLYPILDKINYLLFDE